MASEKKGFVLYFDSYHSIASLPAAQRGVLLSELFQYAARICTQDEDPLAAAEACREMAPETRMAFSFMAGAIARDTKKWKQRRDNLSKAAKEREAVRRDTDSAWDYV